MRLVFCVVMVTLFFQNIFAADKSMNEASLQREVWHHFMAQVVTYQPQKVGIKRFIEAFGINNKSVAGSEILDSSGAKYTDFPKISIAGDALKISSKGSKDIIISLGEPGSGSILINNRKFNLDLNKSIYSQLSTLFAESSNKNSASLLYFLLPEAAASWKVGIGDFAKVAGISFGAAFVTGAATFGGSLVALGTVATAGAVATGTAAICGVGVGLGKIKGSSMGDRFLNCVSKPLSWFGKNPRDRLYLRTLECGGDLRVRLRSSSGIEQVRTFRQSEDRELTSIVLEEDGHKTTLFPKSDLTQILSGQTGAGKIIDRPKNSKELDEAQAMIADYEYYQRVCNDTSRRQEMLSAIREGNEKVRAYDGKGPEKLNNSVN